MLMQPYYFSCAFFKNKTKKLSVNLSTSSSSFHFLTSHSPSYSKVVCRSFFLIHYQENHQQRMWLFPNSFCSMTPTTYSQRNFFGDMRSCNRWREPRRVPASRSWREAGITWSDRITDSFDTRREAWEVGKIFQILNHKLFLLTV